ncbi:hypothetical protein [Massilia sp. Root418]|jgi:hypothetical protein|uniref:hypothetical protein n=1 Tax=Massilia sp. Root418 TaxID=1736532 RepID=UPI000A7E310D|nr:hypothetical protein [Massilia sp. Root418]
MQKRSSKTNTPSSEVGYPNLFPNHVEVHYGRLAFGGDPQLVMFGAQNPDDKKWEASGSGFPVLHKGVVSIVTAGHVAAELEGKSVVLKGPEGSVFLEKQQCRILYNEDVDLALITIPSTQLKTLFSVCICIELDYELRDVADSGISSLYQVYGFPLSKNKFSNTVGWTLEGFRISLGRKAKVPLRSKLLDLEIPLLAFHIDLKEMVDDQLEKFDRLGALKGLSGGPVFRHDTASGAGRIAGVFLEWHSVERTAVVLPAAAIRAAFEAWG